MNIFEYNLLPLIPTFPSFNQPWRPDFNVFSSQDLLTTEEREFFESFSKSGSRSVATIKNCPIGPMQQTTLKVHDAKITWQGNMGSPADLNRSLDKLERMEINGWQRPEMLNQIGAMRPIVAQAVSIFEDIQTVVKGIQKQRHELRQKEKTAEIQELLQTMKALIKKLYDVQLPAELTQESLDQYAKNALAVLEECYKDLQAQKLLLEKIAAEATLKNSPEVVKTDVVGTAVLQNQENTSTQTSETTTISASTTEELASIKSLIDFAFATTKNLRVEFNAFFEDLEKEFPEAKENLGDLATLRNQELDLLEENIKLASTLADVKGCVNKIDHFDAVGRIIINQIKASKERAKSEGKPLADCLAQTKALMEKLAGFNLEFSLQATYDAIKVFFEADQQRNNRWITNLSEDMNYFYDEDFEKIASQYQEVINLHKEAQQTFKLGDNIQKLDEYRKKWNEALEVFKNYGFDRIEPLKNTLKLNNDTLVKAHEQITSWESKNQWILAVDLRYLLSEDPTSPKLILNLSKDGVIENISVEDIDMTNLIARNTAFCKKVEEFIDNAIENSLIDVLEEYEDDVDNETLMERANNVKLQYLTESRKNIEETRKLLETSQTQTKNPEDQTLLQKLNSELQSLLTHFEVATGWFGTNKQQLPLETLSAANLKKYDTALKAKLEKCNQELTRINAPVA